MKLNKYFSYFLILTIIIAIISASIAVVILFRPFYYLNVKLLDLVQITGYSCGDLKYTIEGMNHFTDCRTLFILDIALAILSLSIITVTIILKNNGKIQLTYLKHNFSYYSSIIIMFIFSFITLLAISDFDAMFVKFHQLFFPNKDNWIFDPRYDQIINILPEQFFINCAIVIAAIMFLCCLYFIYKEYKDNYKTKK